MQLGADGVFVGSGIRPPIRSHAPRRSPRQPRTLHLETLARVSTGQEPMRGLDAAALAPEELLETRGW